MVYITFLQQTLLCTSLSPELTLHYVTLQTSLVRDRGLFRLSTFETIQLVSSVCVTPSLTGDPGGVVGVGGEAAGAEVLAAEAGLERGLGALVGQQPHRQHHQPWPRGE